MIRKNRDLDIKSSLSSTKSHTDLRKIDFNHLLGDVMSSKRSSEQLEELSESLKSGDSTPPAKESHQQPDSSKRALQRYYEESLEAIRNGHYDVASAVMQKAILVDLDDRLPSLIVKSCDFWYTRLKRMTHLSTLDAISLLNDAWSSFNKNVVRNDSLLLDRVIIAIRMQVFGRAIEILEKDRSIQSDISHAFALARAYKYRGDYDQAIDAYAAVLELELNHPAALAELADCYAIIDEEINAKVLFREAFFHGADRIIMQNLESVLIQQLYKKCVALHLPEPYIMEWLAVYAVVWGVFSHTRELSNSEYARLNQSIHALRAGLEEHPDKRGYLVPRLIYRLFWLIDYFVATSVDAAATKESIKKVLFEIRFLDEGIYKKYKL